MISLMALAAPVHAELRDFCASRPGLGTPACTVDPGHVMIEIGLADWTLDNAPDARTDTLTAANTTVRIGIGETTEVQLGWMPYGHVRTRDNATGLVTKDQGVGDVTIGVRQSLAGPDGKIAVQPYVMLPTGGSAIGAGDWSAGVIIPIGFDLGHDLQLALSPQVEATANTSGSGRHLSYGSVAGLSAPLTKTLTGTLEIQAIRDEDPSGKATQLFQSASLAWMLDRNTQLDIGEVAGLNRDSPDIELYFGIARRF